MSSITLTQKSKPPIVLTGRNTILIVLAVLVAILAVLAAAPKSAPAATAFDHSAYMLHRQGEWVSVPLTNSAEAYQIFRHGEVDAPVSNAQAYQLYRQGEWVSAGIRAADLSAYRLSERTLVGMQSGLEMYRLSERTRVPVSFTTYQLSEWFSR
jgi:hypothetical protein